MKTAIYIPDAIFEAAEKLAQRLDLSRSQLYSQALEMFIRTHQKEGITEALDQVYAEQSSELDSGWVAVQAASLPADEWSSSVEKSGRLVPERQM